MHPIPFRRSFGALLALIISALLISNWNNIPIGRLAKLEPVVEQDLIFNSSSAPNHAHAHAHAHVVHHYTPLKHSHLHRPHVKRARTLTYHDAVCKGQKLNQQIQEVHDGKRAPGRDFGDKDIDNGWSKQIFPRAIPETFDEPFRAIGKTLPNIGERIPEIGETVHIDLVQDKGFKNSNGKKMKVREIDTHLPPVRRWRGKTTAKEAHAIPMKNNLGAHYEIFYIPSWNAIISADTRSPRYQVQENFDYKISTDNINKQVPPLNRQSDAMWALWKSVTPAPKNLRYICRNAITNEDTRGVMSDIFRKGPTGQPVRWPGLTFGVDTEEGQALLGTPNGLAAAYILMDRGKELGRRQVSVTIAASADPTEPELGYRMLWDMAPPSAPTLSLSLPGAGLGLTFSSSRTAGTVKPAST
ncbi:MAG: hypothetical protein Q9216_004061 [Gyalolechia sp. 2 TL-2023]